jgi:hypothetical protein
MRQRRRLWRWGRNCLDGRRYGSKPSKTPALQQFDTVDVGGVMGPTRAGFITQTPTSPPLIGLPFAQVTPVFGQYSLPFAQKS